MRTAGYADIDEVDLTAEYLATVRRWIAAREDNFEALANVLGAKDVAERIVNGEKTASAIEDGLLARTLYVATR